MDEEHEYPLHVAAAAGDMQKVKELLAAGYDPNGLDDYEFTPLQWVCYVDAGDPQTATTLIAAGADPNLAEKETRRTPLHLAVISENHPLVLELLRHNVDVNTIDFKDLYVFSHACWLGKVETVRALLDTGRVNINEQDPLYHHTPLMMSILYHKPQVAEVLIAAGADLNMQENHKGNTALHMAYWEKQRRVRDLLLERGADFTIRNRAGMLARDFNEWTVRREPFARKRREN